MTALSLSGKILIYLFGLLSILFTFLPFLRFNNWWVRIGDFPRLQIAVVSLVTAVVFVICYRPRAVYDVAIVILLIFCTGYQFYCIVPYTPLFPQQVDDSRQHAEGKNIRILISNVLIDNRDYQSLLDLIEEVGPDVILLSEPDQNWQNAVSILKQDYPYFLEKPLDNAYGMAIYSRFELVNPQLKFLIEDDIPSIHAEIKLASGDVVRFYGIHPRPPAPTESLDTTERDAELIVVGKEAKSLNRPVIIAGDLNDVAWSRTTKLFQKISGMLDPRIGRGLYSSFSVGNPMIRFPLDHVFHSEHFRLVELKRLRNIGSDHFPIFISLNLEQSAELTQEPPSANRTDKKEADEMIEKAVEK